MGGDRAWWTPRATGAGCASKARRRAVTACSRRIAGPRRGDQVAARRFSAPSNSSPWPASSRFIERARRQRSRYDRSRRFTPAARPAGRCLAGQAVLDGSTSAVWVAWHVAAGGSNTSTTLARPSPPGDQQGERRWRRGQRLAAGDQQRPRRLLQLRISGWLVARRAIVACSPAPGGESGSGCSRRDVACNSVRRRRHRSGDQVAKGLADAVEPPAGGAQPALNAGSRLRLGSIGCRSGASALPERWALSASRRSAARALGRQQQSRALAGAPPSSASTVSCSATGDRRRAARRGQSAPTAPGRHRRCAPRQPVEEGRPRGVMPKSPMVTSCGRRPVRARRPERRQQRWRSRRRCPRRPSPAVQVARMRRSRNQIEGPRPGRRAPRSSSHAVSHMLWAMIVLQRHGRVARAAGACSACAGRSSARARGRRRDEHAGGAQSRNHRLHELRWHPRWARRQAAVANPVQQLPRQRRPGLPEGGYSQTGSPASSSPR